ncbi:energy-coupling factor ABC transporter permease [Nitrincola tapanii]|uniref:Molecular chaperone DnaJ n=1 Tax=Nitrincola tapanii TaxID=1708751 RepID=A0A5A9W2B5_9GAMM|nr:energy-coupling factor ABC transporter permease [Nitrincola tapanii]KAA0874644.1 hypothetical protein E1H14_07385 [Nitrincola tapanii]
MSFANGLMQPFWVWLAAAVQIILLTWIVTRLPWSVLLRERTIQHLMFGSVAALVLLWQMKASVAEGLTIHFLGMTLLTLMFGWDLAILLGSLALLIAYLFAAGGVDALAIQMITLVVVPVLVSYGILRWVEAKLPRNFFIYLFACAFFGAGFAVAASGLALAALLWVNQVYSWSEIYHNYAMYLPLIMFPEGLLNGIIMTGMMVFHPDWIRTFDARAYIDEQ